MIYGLISIQSPHCKNIINKLKLLEIRKKAPKEWMDYLSGKTDKKPEPSEWFIYCTKGEPYITLTNEKSARESCCISNGLLPHHLNGKVVAKFTLNKVEELYTEENGMSYYTDTITKDYEVSKLACLDDSDIENYLNGHIGYAWHIDNLEIFDKPKELWEFYTKYYPQFVNMVKNKTHYELILLTKAPQSWQYVEVRNETN